MKNTRGLLFLIIVSFIFRLVLSVDIYSGDLNNHLGWGKSILENGASGAYNRQYTGIMQPTYPPLALYAFTTSSWAFREANRLVNYLNAAVPAFPSHLVWFMEDQDTMPAFQKIVAILSDLGIGILIYLFSLKVFGKSRNISLLAAAVYLFNPAVWYVSAWWGQIDSFPVFWFLLSLWLIHLKKPWLSALSFMAALLSKQSSVIFTPIFYAGFISVFGWKKILKALLLQFALFYLCFLPFTGSVNPVSGMQIYLNRLQTGSGSDYVSDHAFNFWALLTHLAKIPDIRQVLPGITYQFAGTGLFIILAVIFLSRLCVKVITPALMFRMSAVITLTTFLFMTKMHERYLAPALPFVLLSALSSPLLLIPYVLISISHLLNLYHNWWFPRYDWLVALFSDWTFIQIIIGAIILSFVMIIFEMYHYGDRQN